MKDPGSTDRRMAVAQRVLAAFRKDACVKRAFIRGSLLDGRVDEYSDIDIGIDVSGHDNAAYCQTIIETMGRSFDLHFYDWACSLMPQTYVLTFYIKGLPIFWNVDFECGATPHHGTLTREAVSRDTVSGWFKVWALNAKYILRRVPGVEQQIADFGKRALRVETVSHLSPVEIMGNVLANLQDRVQPKHREFAIACQQVYEQQLLSCSA